MRMIAKTSLESYDAIKDKIPNIQKLCLNALEELGCATANEIAYYLYISGITPQYTRCTAGRRISELYANGEIERLPKRKDAITSRLSYCYRIKGDKNTNLKYNFTYTKDTFYNEQDEVLNAIKELGEATSWDIAKFLNNSNKIPNCDKTYVEWSIFNLKSKNKIITVGTGIDEITGRTINKYTIN